MRTKNLEGEVLGNILPRFKGLRVLKLEEADIDELPISIGKLKHLRYLDISGTMVERLPQSVGKLYNLQTLRIESFYLEKCPKELQNLINLRHIYFKKNAMDFPVGMGRLSNLRSLSYFIVGKEKGRGIEELGGLKHLKGKISIYHLEHVRDIEEAKKAKLAEKTNIRKLKFEWGEGRSSAINNDRDVLEGLAPHSELGILKICNFSSDQFPSWMTSGNLFSSLKILSIDNAKNLIEWTGAAIFPRLEELFLRNCNQLKSAPTHFPCLQKLTIDSMDSGMPIANISTQLTTLSHLTIKEMKELASLPEGMLKKNKKLSYLAIRSCPDLTCIAADVFGCCASLESLRIYGCPNLRTLPDGLHTLLSLKELIIRDCKSLECIPVTQGLASLCKFPIDNAKNLIEWTGAAIFPRLEELFLRNCNQLKSAPTHFPCLQKLTIDSMDSGMPIANISTQLTTLTHLTIKEMEELASLPEGMLKKNKNLSYLEIRSCPDLTCIAADVFGCCASLESLSISWCPNLRTLPDGLHTLLSLKELIIRNCDSLECIPVTQGHASLCKFPIFKCLELCILPEGLECCTSLRRLIIDECSKITSISITHGLPSLCELEISNCDELSSLPNGLQHCTSLEHLSITYCPNLEAIPSLDSLTQLRQLEIYNCDGLKGVPLTSAFTASLTRLKELEIGGFWKELDFFPAFQSDVSTST
ncbi:putative disease resistance protein RGA1 [Prunus avium]|uniref:Disease resistance protein RGA1 n=1 Tax=Prunus avium TaxID=42229 RepID=A0A6P5TH30_PRUAV|nr:putative disease resistance protein RGA1 [Prunus avium]